MVRKTRVQQQRQRIVRRMSARRFGVETGSGGIAVPDRQQSLRDRLPSTRLTPLAAAMPDACRRAPQAAHDCPQHHGRDNDDAKPQHEYRQRGLDAPAAR
jgi:hypothetical protein